MDFGRARLRTDESKLGGKKSFRSAARRLDRHICRFQECITQRGSRNGPAQNCIAPSQYIHLHPGPGNGGEAHEIRLSAGDSTVKPVGLKSKVSQLIELRGTARDPDRNRGIGCPDIDGTDVRGALGPGRCAKEGGKESEEKGEASHLRLGG